MMIDEISGDYLQWLRGFYFVAEKGSLRQASIAMGRQQTTISRQIRCLEKELEVTLFDRSSGKMMITPEGKILQEKADALFEYVKQTKDEFKYEEIDYRGGIFIAATSAITYSILPPYVAHFQRLHPEVTFQFEGAKRGMVYEKVESAEADFGIARYEEGHKTLVYRDLYESGMIMIAPKNNPYFSGKTLPTLKQIAEAPLILLAHRGLHEQMIEERFAVNQLKLNVVQSHVNFVNVKKYVAQGMGVAILGRIAISQEDEQNFDIYSLDRYFPKWKYGILLKKKKYHSAMVKAFIRTIKPDIDFSANLEPLDAPVLSLTEFIRRGVGLNQREAPTVTAGRGKKR
jgi:DNA-binding transcriptional LysR family regulator